MKQTLLKRKQSFSPESDYFLYRKGRVTASKCVASLKPNTFPSKTMKELLVNNTPLSTAMLQGLQNEDHCTSIYKKSWTVRGRKESLLQGVGGFFISKTRDFLRASPDGIIIDEEESTPGVVEFKFIQVKPGETLTRPLKTTHYSGKKNHKYYFQMYQHMFVTEYHWGVLIVQGTDGGLFMKSEIY